MMTVKLMGFVVGKLWSRRCAKSNFFRFNAGAGKFGAAYAQVFNLKPLLIFDRFSKIFRFFRGESERRIWYFVILIFQEDGVVFREESGGNNERIGQYRF